MSENWGTVYTCDDWYDGPRAGVADFGGTPHYYRSIYLDTPNWNPDEDRFELTPLSPRAFEAARELQVIWERWNQVRKASTAPIKIEDERVLPADCQRRSELEHLLAEERKANGSRTILVRGKFELGGQRVTWWSVEE